MRTTARKIGGVSCEVSKGERLLPLSVKRKHAFGVGHPEKSRMVECMGNCLHALLCRYLYLDTTK